LFSFSLPLSLSISLCCLRLGVNNAMVRETPEGAAVETVSYGPPGSGGPDGISFFSPDFHTS
jgi:hypothetical protein